MKTLDKLIKIIEETRSRDDCRFSKKCKIKGPGCDNKQTWCPFYLDFMSEKKANKIQNSNDIIYVNKKG